MQNRIKIIISVLIIFLISSTLCFDDNKKKEPEISEEWWDISKFNDFLEQDFEVTYKTKDGSKDIQSIADPSSSLYIAVGIDEPYSGLEAEALFNFVKAGGNILVASDNNTNVNPLALKFGVKFTKHPIVYKWEEIDNNYTFLPVTALGNNITFLIIVHAPLGIEVSAAEYRILAESISEPTRVLSALDVDNDHVPSAKDIPGPYPIIIEITVEKGKAVFISDAGMFSDHLWKIKTKEEKYADRVYENQEFIIDLVYNLHRNDRDVIFDTSKQTEGFSNFHPYYEYPPPEL
jgi:hypothetical protein